MKLVDSGGGGGGGEVSFPRAYGLENGFHAHCEYSVQGELSVGPTTRDSKLVGPTLRISVLRVDQHVIAVKTVIPSANALNEFTEPPFQLGGFTIWHSM